MNIYDPFARYYEADFSSHDEDLPFYHEMARRTGGPLLELMCGTGRVLLPLAAAGYAITGVDISPAMLGVARAKVAEAGLDHSVHLIEGDVRGADLPADTFAMAFVAVNSFMHLEHVKDQLAALATVRRALTRKGLLTIDLFNPDPARLADEDNRLTLDRQYQLDGHQVTKFVAVESDIASQISYVTYLYDEADAEGRIARRTMQFQLRWFYRYELEHLLARAGFMLRAVYGSYDLDTYTSASARLLVVASPAGR